MPADEGSVAASTTLHKRQHPGFLQPTAVVAHWVFTGLLETVLFAKVRFHDTVSRGRLLNRFGKDFETIDSNLADNFGRTVIYGLNATITVFTISVVGGPYFLLAVIVLGTVYWRAAQIYGQTSRDMRRLGESRPR